MSTCTVIETLKNSLILAKPCYGDKNNFIKKKKFDSFNCINEKKPLHACTPGIHHSIHDKYSTVDYFLEKRR